MALPPRCGARTSTSRLHVAPQLKAGVVWVNGTNMFDAACGFGGYRESGFGREGGREGMYEYLRREAAARPGDQAGRSRAARHAEQTEAATAIDRTAKLFIGGKQVRPDGNYSLPCARPQGQLAGEVGLGNRKDIRDAVAAARPARPGREATAYNRSQVLYFWPRTCRSAPTSLPRVWPR